MSWGSWLKWRTGSDWRTVLLLAAAVGVAWWGQGTVRLVAALAAGLLLVFMAYRYRQWNASAWRRVHSRAMEAFAVIVQRHQAIAAREDRTVDMDAACADLARMLTPAGHPDAAAELMADLTRFQGTYLAGLFERHWRDVLPMAPADLREDITGRLRQVRLGPRLLIAAVIERTYGGEEAARYAVALATGDVP